MPDLRRAVFRAFKNVSRGPQDGLASNRAQNHPKSPQDAQDNQTASTVSKTPEDASITTPKKPPDDKIQ
eukprot:6550233-Pyramimonas_sp.AAC.1